MKMFQNVVKRSCAVVLVLLMMGFSVGVVDVLAVTVTVTDGENDSGAGTLRDILQDSNLTGTVDIDFAVDLITIGSASNPITIATTQNADITLKNGLNNLGDLSTFIEDAQNSQDFQSYLDTNLQGIIDNSNTIIITADGQRTKQVIDWVDKPNFKLGVEGIEFRDFNINVGGATLNGGGIIGARTYTNTVGNIVNSIFINNTVRGDSFISGGGIIGVQSATNGKVAEIGDIINNIFNNNNIIATGNNITGGGIIGISGQEGSKIGNITNNIFSNNTIIAERTTINGGGIIGIAGNNNSTIGEISNNIFSNNIVASGQYGFVAGGIIGLSNGNPLFSNSIGKIKNNVFSDNKISSIGNDIYGGIIYSAGLETDLVIENSVFINNTFEVAAGKHVYGGTIGIDTYCQTNSPNGHEVTISATGGKETIFSNNEIIVGGVGDVYNSISFFYEGGNSRADAALNIEIEDGSKVSLLDPISVDTNNSKNFTMGVSGKGDFIWAGENNIKTDGTANFNFEANTNITFLDGFSLNNEGGNFEYTVADNVTFNFKGEVFLDTTETTLEFKGANLNFYVPANMGDGDTMLQVVNADITGSRITVQVQEGVSTLNKGDKIELIVGDISGTPLNTITETRVSTLTTELLYIFGLENEANAMLTATLLDMHSGLNPKTQALSEGKIAGLAFINQGADMVAGFGINSLRSKNYDDSSASGIDKFVPFASVSGGASRYNTGSHIDVPGFSFLAGIGTDASIKDNTLAFGGFFEAGMGSYDSYNEIDALNSIKGKGDINYYGGGLLGRLNIANSNVFSQDGNIYFDASLRAGNLTSDFNSNDYKDSNGVSAQYDSNQMYYGLHVGAGYLWSIDDNKELDTNIKYFHSSVGADSVKLSNGETVNFHESNSDRFRVGTKFLKEFYSGTSIKNTKWYAGINYEYDFSGAQDADFSGLSIKNPTLEGSTYIGEIGLATDWKAFSFDLGLLGFSGVREGLSVKLEAKYRFGGKKAEAQIISKPIKAEKPKEVLVEKIVISEKVAEKKAKPQAKKVDESFGGKLNLEDNTFAFGQTTISPNSPMVNNIFDKIKALNREDYEITITGYTDSIGSDEVNLRVSKQRADALATALVAKGIDKTKIKTYGKGKADPIADNTTAQGRAKNRRVEVEVVKAQN